MSLFGGSTTQNRPPPLFGSSLNVPSSQPQQSGGGPFSSSSQQNTGLGQQSSQPQGSGLFGASQPQQQQQPQQQSSLFGGLGSNTQTQQPLSLSQQPNQSQAQSLWQPGSSFGPREKTIPEQMQTLYDKWNPESPKCLFQKYFYNSVGGERVPFYGPGPDEDEQKWEDALAKKPDDGSVPVLCKGFASMAYRLRMQVESVQTLQARLHEINNSLDEQLRQHELNVSVRAMDARRRHVALSGRCLQLATKIQVLRNRGYVMDSAEEELKKQLDDLAKKAFDSSIISRQEGIWARMFGIRERARVLQKESEKAGVSLATQSDDGVDEEVLRRTKKILQDYDSQISHLRRETEEIGKDYQDWEASSSYQKSTSQ